MRSCGDNQRELVAFRSWRLFLLRRVDQHGDQNQRERDNHPVLKRNAQDRDLPDQPVVQQEPRKAIKKLFLGDRADLVLTGRKTGEISYSHATHRAVGRCAFKRVELDMDQDTKHEIVVLTLGTLAAIPVVTSIGLAVAMGLVAW